MTTQLKYPSLNQVNTKVWLTELSRVLGRPATLDDIPEIKLVRLAEMGFDWIWLLCVWSTVFCPLTFSRHGRENGAL